MSESQQNAKLFLGGLNYETTEDGLHEYFSTFGELVDVVVMRFPDTKRSRGFGFVTFSDPENADACFDARPHTVDKTEIETKKATPKAEMMKNDNGVEPESMRKLFVGGLDYATTDEGLRRHFEQFGELVDSVVMKFRDTKRSRGFGFVTYAKSEMLDVAQNARPHTLDGTKVETKRATPREDVRHGGSGSHGSGHSSSNVMRIFVGGLKEGIDEPVLTDYFSKFGNIVKVELMKEKGSERKRGFAFIEFDDYDPVDKIVLMNNHSINDWRIDVQKAISKKDMQNFRDDRYRREPIGNSRGEPAPWGRNDGYGHKGGYGSGGGGGGYGGHGGGRGNSGWGGGNSGWGGNNSGHGNNSGWGGGGNQPSPWEDNNSWETSNWNDNGGWGSGGNSGGGGGHGGGGYNNSYSSNGPRGMGGPMRNSISGNNRNSPYGMNRGGGFVGGGGYHSRGGAGGGRW